MSKGSDVFNMMWSTWHAGLPSKLAIENPGLLIQLVELADVPGGISQAALVRQMEINQTKVSRLMAKLVDLEWLEVQTTDGDQRLLQVKTAKFAKDSLLTLEEQLSAILPRKLAPARSQNRPTENLTGRLFGEDENQD